VATGAWWRAVHGGVQRRLSDLVGLPFRGLVHAVHAHTIHAHAVEGLPHLHGELVERHEQIVHDAVTGGAGPRLSMGMLRGTGGGLVGRPVGTGSSLAASGLLPLARTAVGVVARGGRGLRQVVVERGRVGVVQSPRTRSGRQRTVRSRRRLQSCRRTTSRHARSRYVVRRSRTLPQQARCRHSSNCNARLKAVSSSGP
jgi:hypothetical protein